MMNLKVLVLLVLAIIAASVFAPVGEGGRNSEEAIPPNPSGFLGGDWHPAPECVQCHVSLLSEAALRAKLGSCECHRETYTSGGNIDMGKIRTNAHDIKACINCHIGSGMESFLTIPSDEIHNVHVNVDCQGCHDERELITIPKTGRCEACHSANPHTVHGDKTGDLCVVCHGSYGIKYKEEGYQMEEGVPVEVVQEESIYPTISNTVKAFFEFLFK